MDKTIDEQIIETKNKILVAVRESKLPITVLTMMMNEITQVLMIQQQATLVSIEANKSKRGEQNGVQGS